MNEASSDCPLLLTERVSRRVRLAPAEVAFLLDHHRARFDLEATPRPRIWRIRPRGIVGVLAGPRRTIIIRPKIPLINLAYLLDPDTTPEIDPTAAAADPRSEAFALLATLFLRRLNDLIDAGLHRGYEEEQGSGTVLHGTPDLAAQLRAGLGRKDVLHYRRDDLTPNVPVNRLLLAVVEQLLRMPLSPPTRDGLAATLPAFANVTPISLDPAAFVGVTLDRQTERYGVALELGRMLIEGGIPALAAGRGPSFLLDLERVFERYVTRGVEAAFADEPAARVEVQPRFTIVPEADGPALVLRPDVIVTLTPPPGPLSASGRGEEKTPPPSLPGKGAGGLGSGLEALRLVIDAKWKRLPADGLVTDDVYQVATYGAALEVPRVVLVYPGGRDRAWLYTLPRVVVAVRTVRVTGTRSACERSLSRLRQALRRGG